MDRGACLKAALLGLLLWAVPAGGEDTNQTVHAAERAAFGFATLRPGANAANPEARNAANRDEALVGTYTLPPLFEEPQQQTPQGWPARRAAIVRLVEDNWVGRVPDVVQGFRVEWEKLPQDRVDTFVHHDGEVLEQWNGRVVTADGRSGPVITARLHIPARATAPVSSIIDFAFGWVTAPAPARAGATPQPSPIRQALDRGWAWIEYRPQFLQADNAAEMQQGIIGLARWPRQQFDWGALRAWAWGASQLRMELARDPRFDARMITLTGHSRFGKAVLVAAAFDHAFADAHVSSSGAGGAKLMRRDFGERWENLAGAGGFHWFTPNIMRFAADPLTVHDLPVDAHMLIALRAPRPLFITSGLAEKGDSWVDPTGMWAGMMAAQPAWELHGAPVPRFGMPLPESREQMPYPLAWYQHGEGHVPWPAYDKFYEHAEMFGRD